MSFVVRDIVGTPAALHNSKPLLPGCFCRVSDHDHDVVPDLTSYESCIERIPHTDANLKYDYVVQKR